MGALAPSHGFSGGGRAPHAVVIRMTDLRFDEDGLIPAVAQDRFTGQVRMVGWMNREALERTLVTGRATFWSRSRNALWEKGETSGNFLQVESIWADCDADTLLLLVAPRGPTCHTGRPSCFFQRVGGDGVRTDPQEASAELQRLEQTIAERAEGSAELSYTKRLLDGGAAAIGEKLREEASELAVALGEESEQRVANEAADLLYHLLAGLRLRRVPLSEVLAQLAGRSGRSGLAEKASRGVEKP
jgi:phosphoribosyl-AMP cyclohydrolase / phosphoribosyl-ATP pyrophosphohydrolase